MPCYHPIPAWKAKRLWRKKDGTFGKRAVVFSRHEGIHNQTLNLPCGRCIGCKLERSRQWAARCMHEASLYDQNCFITLTYSDEHLPANGSLVPKHFVDFMKRLRKKYGEGIRFFHCGEYGEQTARPHHHALLFNHNFPDRQLLHPGSGNSQLYTSEALQKLWPWGMSSIGNVTFDSAAYVARYTTKKITGPDAEQHYQGRVPEYLTMSRRPGIASEWITKYMQEVFPSDEIIVNGVPCKPPRFYDIRFKNENPKKFILVQRKRRYNATGNEDNNQTRRNVKESLVTHRHSRFKREPE